MTKRSEQRYDEREFIERPITFRTSAHRSVRSEDVAKKGICIDISSSGLGLVADCQLQKGEVMEVHVPVGVKDVTVKVFAEVRWSAFAGDITRSGLRFL